MTKIGIIGFGKVGNHIAYDLAIRKLADEIAIIDLFENSQIKSTVEGDIYDILHAVAGETDVNIHLSDYEDIKDSDMIIITAGKARAQNGTESRLDLAKFNTSLIKDIAHKLKSFNGVVITISNPLDVMNYVFWKESGLDRKKVIGSSGELDSARFIHLLSEELKEKPTNVMAYVLGEHGDDQVPIFSRIGLHGKTPNLSPEQKENLRKDLVSASKVVVDNKGATWFAPSHHTANLVEAIVKDSGRLMICSVILQGEYGISDISLGVPVKIGAEGIEHIDIWQLDSQESTALKNASEKLKKFISEV